MHEPEPSDGLIISTTDAPQGVTGHNGLMHGRRHNRLTNRPGKQGFTFLHWEQGATPASLPFSTPSRPCRRRTTPTEAAAPSRFRALSSPSPVRV
jgi:hypothetical protein